MSKDIKKALEHCAEWKCDNCPNGDELGSGEIVCRGRLLPQVLEYISDLESKLAEKDKEIEYLNKQARKFNNEAQKYFEDAYCNDTIYQDKISFALEQLEKVSQDFSMRVGITDSNMDLLNEIIDNQIEELKKETK